MCLDDNVTGCIWKTSDRVYFLHTAIIIPRGHMDTCKKLGLAIFDTTHKPDTNTTRENRVWVYCNRVRVIIGFEIKIGLSR
jgi:hypothetical protein